MAPTDDDDGTNMETLRKVFPNIPDAKVEQLQSDFEKMSPAEVDQAYKEFMSQVDDVSQKVCIAADGAFLVCFFPREERMMSESPQSVKCSASTPQPPVTLFFGVKCFAVFFGVEWGVLDR